MQIQALSFNCHKPSFLGNKYKQIGSKNYGTDAIETQQMTNEEVLAAAKSRMAKRAPVFTPRQKEILPEVERFNDSGILDIMSDYLNEVDEFIKAERKMDIESDSACFDKDGRHYCYKKELLPDTNGYNISFKASDEDGEDLYSCTIKTRGGYSKYSLKSEFEDFGKVEIARQGEFGSSAFFVDNVEEGYIFSGKINEDGEGVVDGIVNIG